MTDFNEQFKQAGRAMEQSMKQREEIESIPEQRAKWIPFMNEVLILLGGCSCLSLRFGWEVGLAALCFYLLWMINKND